MTYIACGPGMSLTCLSLAAGNRNPSCLVRLYKSRLSSHTWGKSASSQQREPAHTQHASPYDVPLHLCHWQPFVAQATAVVSTGCRKPVHCSESQQSLRFPATYGRRNRAAGPRRKTVASHRLPRKASQESGRKVQQKLSAYRHISCCCRVQLQSGCCRQNPNASLNGI